MQRFSYRLALAVTALALAGCADTAQTGTPRGQLPSEQQNHRELCQKWVGNPDDPECLSTFRRILP